MGKFDVGLRYRKDKQDNARDQVERKEDLRGGQGHTQ